MPAGKGAMALRKPRSPPPRPAHCRYTYRESASCHTEGESCRNPVVADGLCQWHREIRGKQLRGVDLQTASDEARHLCEAYLVEADLRYAKLQDANLTGANLQGAIVAWARLGRAKLIRAKLDRTRLVRADLREAMLDLAVLQETDLSGADLQLAHLDGAVVHGVLLTGAEGPARLQLSTLKSAEPSSLNDRRHLIATRQPIYWLRDRKSGSVGTRCVGNDLADARDPHDVAQDHRLLKLYFRQEGQPDRSSWHYLAEMRWMRRHYRCTHQLRQLVKSTLYWGLCGYGEWPWLVVVWSCLSVLVCWGLLVGNNLLSGIVAPEAWPGYWLASLWAFATGPVPELLASAAPWGVMAALGEAVVGKFLLALFVFTLGRKVER